MKPKAAGTFLSLRRPATQATRRAKSGSERYPLLSSALFTLFAPSAATNKTVYLIDLRGEVVHTWEMPYPPGYGYLTERGTLFYNGKIPNQSRIGRAAYMCGAALEMDWKGKVLWEVRHPEHTHDGIRLKNANVLLICKKPLPEDVASKVSGGRPGTEYDNGKMIGDRRLEPSLYARARVNGH